MNSNGKNPVVRETEQDVYVLIKVPFYGTEHQADGMVTDLARDLELFFGKPVGTRRVHPSHQLKKQFDG